jgi:predicted  nucleic acid-binding Zn-ribbon protein
VLDQLRLLAELQQLESRLRVLEIERQELPQQLHPYQQACHNVREELTAVQSEMEAIERRRRALEREIDTDNDRLIKAQNRLREVKTNKEYSAVLAEIDVGKQRIRTLEDQVLELMEGVEQKQVASQRCEQHLQDLCRELAEHEHRVSEAQDALSGDIAARDHERGELITRIQPDLYTAYQQAARRAGGVAVVEVMADETCGGCYLRIRPQLISEVRKQEHLVSCPHCRRILLWPASETV